MMSERMIRGEQINNIFSQSLYRIEDHKYGEPYKVYPFLVSIHQPQSETTPREARWALLHSSHALPFLPPALGLANTKYKGICHSPPAAQT
jgi:hypothetical protein